MVRNDVLCEIEPELGHTVQYHPFFRNGALQDIIKSRNAVGAYHDKAVAQIVEFADFTGFKRFVFFHCFSPLKM